MAPSIMAQSDAVVGKWSGQWDPDGNGIPDGVTIELKIEDGALKGGIIGHNAREFVEISFDPDANKLVLETRTEDSGTSFRIEATVEGTRMNGTVAHGDTRGDFRLTKWTYRPGLR